MTDPVIRTLDDSTAHLFDTLPDPLRLRETHRRTHGSQHRTVATTRHHASRTAPVPATVDP
ncbi:hypothetical protein AB0D38_29100, partial [Streptomyces sp. NPDC048279]